MKKQTEVTVSSQHINVKFEVLGSNDFQGYKHLNEFLRTSYREFAATYGIIDFEVKE